MKVIKPFFRFTFLLLVSSLFFAACEKDCAIEPETNTVPGLWIGTYTVNQVPAQGALYYSFIFKPDGKVLTEGKGGNGASYYSQGTWTLTGNEINCSYTSINFPGVTVTQSAKFTFSASSDSLSAGTWTDVSGGVNSGKFQLMKKVK
jgi:hypothetical protein